MKYILRPLSWMLCLCLRCTAWVCTRAHERLKSGPQARLWAATDHELMAEAKRRGGLPRKRAKVVEIIPAPITKTVRTEDSEVVLAIKTVSLLNQLPEDKAEELVIRALSKWEKKEKPTADVIAALVLAPVKASSLTQGQIGQRLTASGTLPKVM